MRYVPVTLLHPPPSLRFTLPPQIRALILENTFLSLPRLVPTALPVLGPFAFLCHQKWDSASKVQLIPRKTPVLMLSGLKDEVVPCEHMQGLWEIVKRRDAGVEGGQGGKGIGGGEGLTAKEGKNAGTVAYVENTKTLSKYLEFAEGTHSEFTILFEGFIKCASY